jgi:hypothetical protein
MNRPDTKYTILRAVAVSVAIYQLTPLFIIGEITAQDIDKIQFSMLREALHLSKELDIDQFMSLLGLTKISDTIYRLSHCPEPPRRALDDGATQIKQLSEVSNDHLRLLNSLSSCWLYNRKPLRCAPHRLIVGIHHPCDSAIEALHLPEN